MSKLLFLPVPTMVSPKILKAALLLTSGWLYRIRNWLSLLLIEALAEVPGIGPGTAKGIRWLVREGPGEPYAGY